MNEYSDHKIFLHTNTKKGAIKILEILNSLYPNIRFNFEKEEKGYWITGPKSIASSIIDLLLNIPIQEEEFLSDILLKTSISELKTAKYLYERGEPYIS